MDDINDEIRATIERLRALGRVVEDPKPIPPPATNQADAAILCGAPDAYRFSTRASWNGPWPLPEWDGDPWCLVVLGEPGRGKTHAATALFDQIARRRGLKAWWISWPRAMRALKAEMKFQPEGWTMEAKLFCDRLILLDDVGATRDTDYEVETLRSVIIERFDRRLPTIITTNAPNLEAFAAIDERISSRLSAGKGVTLRGRDLRRTA